MPTTTYAIPMSLTIRSPECDYCGAESIGNYPAIHRLHGIKMCAAHQSLAARDVSAYLHTKQVVKVEDFLERFPLLTDLTSIKVPRSDGSVTLGASLMRSNFEESAFVRYSPNGHWNIRVVWPTPAGEMNKDIKVKDLALSGVDVAPIMAVLEAGFYKEAYDAQEAAIAQGAKVSGEHLAAAVAEVINSAPGANGVVCRALMPDGRVQYIGVSNS